MVFRNFLGNNFFFRSDPQVVAKGDLLGFWPILGRGHLEKFRARAKNRKTQFPGARGTFGGKNVATLAGMVFRNSFFRSDPHRLNTVIWWYFGPFWAWGTLRNSGPRPKTEKTQFPGARGTLGGENPPPQKFLPEIAQLFYTFHFGRPDPQGREIAKHWLFGPFWPRTALGT